MRDDAETVLPHPADRHAVDDPQDTALPEPARRRVWLRTPSVTDQIRLDRLIAAAGGRRHGMAAMGQALQASFARLRAALPEGHAVDVDGWQAALEDHAAAFTAWLETGQAQGWGAEETRTAFAALAEADEAVAPLLRVCQEHDPRLANMMGDEQVYPQIEGLCAARLLVEGWQQIPGGASAPPRGLDGLMEETAAGRLSAGHRVTIGRRARALMAPPEATAKN
jgi:hypothetical protein